MSDKLSRRKLASYTADRLLGGHQAVIEQLAAYLVRTGRTKESELVVRDIETALLSKGKVVATITSARPLSAEAKEDVKKFISSEYSSVQSIELIEHIDESVIGGVRINLPNAVLDTTVKTKLESLGA